MTSHEQSALVSSAEVRVAWQSRVLVAGRGHYARCTGSPNRFSIAFGGTPDLLDYDVLAYGLSCCVPQQAPDEPPGMESFDAPMLLDLALLGHTPWFPHHLPKPPRLSIIRPSSSRPAVTKSAI